MKKIKANKFIKTFCKIILTQAFLLIVAVKPALCNNSNDSIKNNLAHPAKNKIHKFLNIKEYLQVFYPVDNAEYSVTVCGDLPVNDNPKCVFKKGEPGHVFLILTRQNPATAEIITRSFGFYPRVPVSCIFKQVRSVIHDNSNREYDVSIEKKLTKEEFAGVLEKCKELSKKKYNLNRYNCYNYVLEVFNSLPGIEKLPFTNVKFPFIFGKGGSPCGLYRDLKNLLTANSLWVSNIRFGLFKSPPSVNPKNLIASF